MHVTFWGVRGSTPTPGPRTVRYGGNTPCLTIGLDHRHTLVLDAGTGLSSYGRTLSNHDHTWFVLLSHVHWDHIQGLPLFPPLMSEKARIVFLTDVQPSFMDQALAQLDGVHFPLESTHLKADVSAAREPAGSILKPFGVSLSHLLLDHSGPCFSYRLSGPTRDLVYMTDNELTPDRTEVVDFCRGADILVHDAQYLDSERRKHAGWGHSFVPDVCELARQAGVGELILFHHDPGRSDDELDAIQNDAQVSLDASITCTVAAEGLQRTV